MKNELELRKQLASAEPVKWVQSYIKEFTDIVEEYKKNILNIHYINTQDIKSFQKEVEQLAKDNPDANIKASGFVMTSKKGKKPKIEKYEYSSE